eukprot:1965706-Pyramimonas_sp.AAC.1
MLPGATDFEADLRRDLWTTATRQEYGDNLEEGGDLRPIAREQRRFERNGVLGQLALHATALA